MNLMNLDMGMFEVAPSQYEIWVKMEKDITKGIADDQAELLSIPFYRFIYRSGVEKRIKNDMVLLSIVKRRIADYIYYQAYEQYLRNLIQQELAKEREEYDT